MAIFGLGKKKEEAKETCGCAAGDVKEVKESCCGSADNAQKTVLCTCGGNEAITNVKILGGGCKSCHDLYENAKKAVANLGLSVEVEYITDIEKVMEYGAMRMPALVVNEKVVATGNVLKPAQIENILGKFGC